MRSVLKNKKGVQFGMNEFLILLIGLVVILIVLYFMFGKEWGAMVRNFLPTMETTTDKDYSTISGTDEVFYDLPSGLPSFDFTKRNVDDCPYYAIKYTEGIFSVFNSSGNRIGALKKRDVPVDSWNLYDLSSLIKVIQQGALEGSGVLNDINYYGKKEDSANNFYFDGQKIVCSVAPTETTKSGADTSSNGIVKADEYYVSDKDCYNTWNFADEYCIIKKNSSGEYKTKLYLTTNNFEGSKYPLNARTGNLGFGDSKNLCNLVVGSLVTDCLIIFADSSYSGESINMRNRIFQKDGKFVLSNLVS